MANNDRVLALAQIKSSVTLTYFSASTTKATQGSDVTGSH